MNHTEPGDTVYDPFLGSGTTLAAKEAEGSGRGCLGIDIDPGYVDVVVCDGRRSPASRRFWTEKAGPLRM